MTSFLEIRRASIKDLDATWKIIDECGKWLGKNGLNYWSDYFTKHRVEQLFEKTEIYLGYLNRQSVGVIALSRTPPHYYLDQEYLNKFTDSQENSAYLIVLGTLPEQQGHGYASQMLEFAENTVKESGVLWLRSDCRAEDGSLVKFYEKRGMNKVGEQPMNEGTHENYWLIEKKLLK